METIGNRIQQVIDDNCPDQADFARTLGKRRETVNRWVKGHQSPGITDVGQICVMYEVNAHWLLFGTEK